MICNVNKYFNIIQYCKHIHSLKLPKELCKAIKDSLIQR